MSQQHNKSNSFPQWMKTAGIILLFIAIVFMKLDYIEAKIIQLKDIVAGPLATISIWSLIFFGAFVFLFKKIKK